MKYVLVSGGVISGVGKGIIASSTGLLLKTMGLKICAPPKRVLETHADCHCTHGEVFVLDDGGEVDLDLGNYERYLNITLTRENNITTGKIYQQVIERERRGDYLGHTVQVVPHIVDAIQDWIERVARIPVDDTGEEPDVCIIELGGTVGDIESMPFVHAMTQLRRRAGRDNFLQIHVSYVPVINGEQKTKPTQQAIRDVRSAMLVPDLIACRCELPLEPSTISKIAKSCQVDVVDVIAVRNMPSTYQVPILLYDQGLLPRLEYFLRLEALNISPGLKMKGSNIWQRWKSLTSSGHERFYEPVDIALVGKYIELKDAYASVTKSLEHSAMRCKRRLNIIWVDAEHLEPQTEKSDPMRYHKAWHDICSAHGILVPGGFGQRGTEGMIAAARYAREEKRPYLGICLGMQIAVVEFARSVCGMQAPVATSEEFDATDGDRIIISMPEHHGEKMGATMRLGLRATVWQEGSEWSRLRKLYSTSSSPSLSQTPSSNNKILERHRHRYEVNPAYIPMLEAEGLTFVGKDETGVRMEIIELKEHPWFVGVQFHPEYLSRVLHPSKPYLGFVAASADCLEEVTRNMSVDGLANGVNGVNGDAAF
ncbi:CTP synthase ura7 [Elasticomyces elasticus]|nr:CTP synthase ura7 [Elasticomyces elasticus]